MQNNSSKYNFKVKWVSKSTPTKISAMNTLKGNWATRVNSAVHVLRVSATTDTTKLLH